MNSSECKSHIKVIGLIISTVIWLCQTPLALGQSVQHLSITQPGGIPGQPLVTGVIPTTTNVTVTWDGPSGYYQLFEKTNLTDPNWHALGARTNLTRRQVVPGVNPNELSRVLGP